MTQQATTASLTGHRLVQTCRGGLVVLAAVAGIGLPSTVLANPEIIPNFEGQFGTTPGAGEDIDAASFWVFSAGLTDVPYTLRINDTNVIDIEKDNLHGQQSPAEIDERASSFFSVFKGPPATASWFNVDDDLAGVFAYAEDGSMTSTQGVTVAIVPSTSGAPTYVPLGNVPTFFVPDELFNKTAVAADAAGNITVLFTEFVMPGPEPKVRAQRLDKTGSLIGGFFDITDNLHTAPEVALLDPNGDRLVVPTIDVTTFQIRGNIVDFTGPTPSVLPEFPISGMPVFNHLRPVVAADTATGTFTVVWEDITGVSGNPVDLKARRFDATGTPIAPEFTVNTTTADAQGQPDVAYGPNGESVIVWAGDPLPGGNLLDIFAQAYDASGQPIGGEIQVNSNTTGNQDRPQVQFLGDTDPKGRVQFVVAWRDVVSAVDNTPNGTGHSYKCFAIGDGPALIFADGFESGDTSSWSSATQN